MQWVSAMVERGAGHHGSTEEGCPSPSCQVKKGGYSSLGLFSELSILTGQCGEQESSGRLKHEGLPNQCSPDFLIPFGGTGQSSW